MSNEDTTANDLADIASKTLTDAGLDVGVIYRLMEEQGPDALDLIADGKIDLIINTPTRESGVIRDGARMRRLAIERGIPFAATLATARAWVEAISDNPEEGFTVAPIKRAPLAGNPHDADSKLPSPPPT